MNSDPGDLPELSPYHDMMELFEKLSFRERVAKVVRGLKAPHESGDYKYARLQLIRLISPASAVIVPILILIALTIVASVAPVQDAIYDVKMVDPKPLKELEEPEPLPELEPPKDVELDFQPDVTMPIADISAPPTDFSPQPADFDSVAITRSPVIMRGIYGSRNPGAIGSALGSYGGSQRTEDAVLRALRWLKKHQEQDGSWSLSSGGKAGTAPGAEPAMTGFALLAFLAHGETPASKEFGPTVERGLRWMVDGQGADARFKGRDGNDYSHPIAAYALCEAYGITRVPMLKEVAERAVDIIIKGQHQSGGWNYRCAGPEERNDTSYMGWCAQAMKAAYIAGLENEGMKTCLRKAVDGFKLNSHPSGGFGYTTPGAGGLTGVGVLCMQLLGAQREPECRRGVTWLEQVTFDWDDPWGGRPIYYWYYITQAKFHEGGDTWRKWNRLFSNELVSNQTVLKGAGLDGKDIGYWDGPRENETPSRVYSTTLCCLMLEVYYRYLPTYKPPTPIEEPEDVIADDEIEIQVEIENDA